MTATEIINEIKSLPVEERERVAAFLRDYDGVRYADDQRVDATAGRIMDRHAPLMRELAK